jgi:Uma2 family endonuclease
LLHDFVEWFDLGKVYGARVAFKLDDVNSPEPDIGVLLKERLDRVQRGHIKGPPDLAIEIVSPESIERDYGKKRRQYEQFGVREYWIIDEIKRKVPLLQLDGKGKYRLAKPSRGKLHSIVLPGFWVRSAWFWPDSRPRKVDALNEILKSMQ